MDHDFCTEPSHQDEENISQLAHYYLFCLLSTHINLYVVYLEAKFVQHVLPAFHAYICFSRWNLVIINSYLYFSLFFTYTIHGWYAWNNHTGRRVGSHLLLIIFIILCGCTLYLIFYCINIKPEQFLSMNEIANAARSLPIALLAVTMDNFFLKYLCMLQERNNFVDFFIPFWWHSTPIEISSN